MEAEEFLGMLRTRTPVIIGAGYTAELFWQALAQHGLAGRVACCAVSGGGGVFHGLPVRPLETAAFPPDAVLCLAVHAAVAQQLLPALEARGLPAVHVAPMMPDLLFGRPEARRTVRVPDVVRAQGGSLWLPARYVLARDYLRRDPAYAKTRALYCRLMAMHCGAGTAVRRADALERLADSMARRGFDAAFPPAVDTRLRVVDGLHRIACARLLGVREVPAAVYPASGRFEAFYTERNRLPEDFLRRSGFSGEEVAFLLRAEEEMEAEA